MKDERLRKRLARMLPDSPDQSPVDSAAARRVGVAKAAFMDGYHQALEAQADRLSRLLDEVEDPRRGFALEGAGMAAVLVDELSGRSGLLTGALVAGRTHAEETLIAIGAGWAAARLRRSPDWLPPGLAPRCAYAVADGYGFHQGFFHPNRFSGRGFPAVEGPIGASHDVGLGRALWFIHLGDVGRIDQDVEAVHVDRRAAVWRGAGTACAFTGNTDFEPPNEKFRIGFDRGVELLHALAESQQEVTT